MTRKKVYLEWMRVIAILLVLFNHLPGYSLYQETSGAAQGALMFLSMLTRVNVPLFLMISGALLLGRQEDFATVLRRRAARIAAVIVLFSLGLYLGHAAYYAWIKHEARDYSLRRFLYAIFSVNVDGAASYWYLYSFLAYLLMLPYLQRIAHGFQREDFGALLVMRTLLAVCLPVLNLILWLKGQPRLNVTNDLSLPLAVTQSFFYPLMGYYLDRLEIEKLRRRTLLIAALAGVAGLAAACACTYAQAARGGAFTQDYVQLCSYIAAIAAFLLIKRFTCVTCPGLCRGRAAGCVCLLGSLTFGIYLLDPYLKLTLWGAFTRLLPADCPPMALSIAWCLVSVAVGGTLTWALKKLPILKKLL